MMQPQNLDPQTVAAILAAPSTRAALAQAEAARTRERSELLRALAEAELATAVAADELAARAAELQKVYLPLAEKAGDARRALQMAEAEGFAAGLAADAKIGALRARLGPLGDGALAAARGALALERRAAEGALSWRSVTERKFGATETHTEASPANVGAHALIAEIAAALAELDALERDATAGPGEIERRITEIRAGIEAAKSGTPTPRRGQFINPRGDVGSRRQVATMTERVQR